MKNIFNFLITSVFIFLVACQQEEPESIIKPNTKDGSSIVEEAFPKETGIIEKGHLYGTPIEFARINGLAVFQGDIILTPEQLTKTEPSGKRNGRTEGAGRTFLPSRWPDNLVYYTLDPALPQESRTRVANAITHWQTYTPIRFASRTTQTNYVTFRPGDGCSSNVGMIGVQQFIHISTACSTGSIIHEIGHTLGLWHEQSRADRNAHITINWNNIEVGKAHNFQTYVEQGQDGFDHGPFDFNSIMMYGPYSFSNNNLPTITRKDGSLYTTQRSALSTGDKAIINLMYSASSGVKTAQGDDMLPGEVLTADQAITSANGRYRLIYQADGNLVLYDGTKALWHSATNGQPVGVCVMQHDGNLVIYGRRNQVIWASNSHGNASSRLVVQDDGNVVIYRPEGRAVWASNTVQT